MFDPAKVVSEIYKLHPGVNVVPEVNHRTGERIDYYAKLLTRKHTLEFVFKILNRSAVGGETLHTILREVMAAIEEEMVDAKLERQNSVGSLTPTVQDEETAA